MTAGQIEAGKLYIYIGTMWYTYGTKVKCVRMVSGNPIVSDVNGREMFVSANEIAEINQTPFAIVENIYA